MNRSANIGKLTLISCLLISFGTALAQTSTQTETSTHVPAPVIQGTKLDYIVATVNDTPILKSELDAAVAVTEQSLKAQNQPIPSSQVLEVQMLDRLITRSTQMAIIERLGQSINNQVVNEALQSIAVNQGAKNLSELQRILEAKQPGSYRQLREQVRQEMAIGQLQQQELNRRVNITEQDIDNFLQSPESQRLFDIEYNTNHIRIFLPIKTATAAQKAEAMMLAGQVKQMLDSGMSIDSVVQNIKDVSELTIQGGNMGFHAEKELPSYLKQDILGLKVGDASQPIVNKDGVHVVQLADIKDKTNETVHQWQVRHILIKPNQVQNLAQSKQRIDDLYEQLRLGANFATLASTYSDDPGSAKRGGSLDWVTSGQMVPEFEAVMKNTETGDFSTPFQSQFGWHILKVEAQRDQDLSQEYKRLLARETLFKRMSTQAIEDWMQELRAQSHIEILDSRFKDNS